MLFRVHRLGQRDRRNTDLSFGLVSFLRQPRRSQGSTIHGVAVVVLPSKDTRRIEDHPASRSTVAPTTVPPRISASHVPVYPNKVSWCVISSSSTLVVVGDTCVEIKGVHLTHAWLIFHAGRDWASGAVVEHDRIAARLRALAPRRASAWLGVVRKRSNGVSTNKLRLS